MQNLALDLTQSTPLDITKELVGEDALAYCTRGAARSSAGQYEKAIADFDAAKLIEPGCSRAYWLTAIAYEKLGSDKALEQFNQAIKLYCAEGNTSMAKAIKSQLERYQKEQERSV
ncbi:MAG: hypothetical protein AAGE59_28350 [Cyanobacteria bacterium P01_F01_bin.86]